MEKAIEALNELYPEFDGVSIDVSDKGLILQFEFDDGNYLDVPFSMFEDAKRLLKEFNFDIK